MLYKYAGGTVPLKLSLYSDYSGTPATTPYASVNFTTQYSSWGDRGWFNKNLTADDSFGFYFLILTIIS